MKKIIWGKNHHYRKLLLQWADKRVMPVPVNFRQLMKLVRLMWRFNEVPLHLWYSDNSPYLLFVQFEHILLGILPDGSSHS